LLRFPRARRSVSRDYRRVVLFGATTATEYVVVPEVKLELPPDVAVIVHVPVPTAMSKAALIKHGPVSLITTGEPDAAEPVSKRFCPRLIVIVVPGVHAA
jgi:hypothetical protein